VIGMALHASTEAQAQAQPQADFTTPAGATAAVAPLVGLTSTTDTYPNLVEWAASPSGASVTEPLELGLTMFLDGIAARHPGRLPAIPGVRAKRVRRRPRIVLRSLAVRRSGRA
jgi:hypothetical protein